MCEQITSFKNCLDERRIVIVDGMKIDWRWIPHENGDVPILLLTGFGSGWEGIVELAWELFSRGKSVILVSLPGYGASDNAHQKYMDILQKASDFNPEGQVLGKFLEEILPQIGSDRVHLAGHSMGAQICAHAVKKWTNSVNSLTLVTPSGLPNDSAPWWNKMMSSSFFTRLIMFSLSGLQTRILMRKQESLRFGCLSQRSAWFKRINQRLQEGRRLKCATLSVGASCPTLAIFGGNDLMVHASSAKYLPCSVYRRVVPEFTHNPTLFGVARLAYIIVEFTDSA